MASDTKALLVEARERLDQMRRWRPTSFYGDHPTTDEDIMVRLADALASAEANLAAARLVLGYYESATKFDRGAMARAVLKEIDAAGIRADAT